MSDNTQNKKVLMLGAGRVSRPGVVYLLEQGFEVLVAARAVSKTSALVGDHPRGKALAFSIDDRDTLARLVAEADVTISLLPAPLHPVVAEACLEAGKPLVTTSYVGPAMQALDARAKEAGVLLLNEIGMDPGIDHMSAMKIIHEVEAAGDRVVGFRSCCGGLPAPDANNNPWGYKFSWSPRAVLTAGTSPAQFCTDGEQVDIPAAELFANHWPQEVPGAGIFESYPNRDSLSYLETYGLEGVRTMFRGTLRYPGWCDTLKLVVDLGLLDQSERTDLAGQSYAALMASLVPGATAETVRADLAQHVGLAADSNPLERLAWAGFFGDEIVPEVSCLLDAVGARLEGLLVYGDGERDMIVLHHEFEVETAAGGKRRLTSTLVDYGIPDGDSSMARTVSLPCAVATRFALEGRFDLTGVHIPTAKAIYEPVLAELETLGIVCNEVELPVE